MVFALGGAGLLTTFIPFIGAMGGASAAAATATLTVGGAATVAFATIAIPLVIVVMVVIAVVSVFEVVEDQQTLADLKDLDNLYATATTTPPNLAALAQDPAGVMKLTAAFTFASLPDQPSTVALPLHGNSDPTFSITRSGGVAAGSPVVRYKDWLGTTWISQTYGGWLIQQGLAAGNVAVSSISPTIQFFDWSGKAYYASRIANDLFLIVKGQSSPTDRICVADPVSGVSNVADVSSCYSYVSASIPLTDDNGQHVTVSLSAAPVVTSPATTAFGADAPFQTFNITASGGPAPGITFGPNPDADSFNLVPTGSNGLVGGQAQIQFYGHRAIASGVYTIPITAINTAGTTTQNLVITVGDKPAFTSNSTANFVGGVPGSFVISASGFPLPSISLGPGFPVPSGLSLHDNGDGTATVSGTPNSEACLSSGFNTIFEATNQYGSATLSVTINTNCASSATYEGPGSVTWDAQSANSITVGSGGAQFSIRQFIPGAPAFIFPPAQVTYPCSLPVDVAAWLSCTDNGNGTQTLTGTPPLSALGSHILQFQPHAIGSLADTPPSQMVLYVGQPRLFNLLPDVHYFSGQSGSPLIFTSTDPAATFTETGLLPTSIKFTGGTGSFSLFYDDSAPGVTGGLFPIEVVGQNAYGTQTFDQNVYILAPPIIASFAGNTFFTGRANTFSVQTSGYPGTPINNATLNTPGTTITIPQGVLPPGVTFIATNSSGQNTGTGTFAGTPCDLCSGVYPFTITATNLAGTATQAFTLTVLPGNASLPAPAVTWNTPAAITYGTALSATQLNATASVPGTFAYVPSAGRVLTTGTNQLQALFTPADTGDYSMAIGSTNITVNQATPAITWPAPAAVVFGTALSPTQLNAVAGVPGTLVYNPPLGTVLPVGSAQPLSVTLTPTDAINYTTATLANSINVGSPSSPLAQSITFATPANHTYGDGPFSVSPTASSGLAVTVASTTPAVCTYGAGLVSILSAGTCSLTASQAGTGSIYAAATSVVRSFTVQKATGSAALAAFVINPVGYGQTVTLQANIGPLVSPTIARPSGMVTFMNGGATLGTAPVTNYTATLNISSLPVGADSITAVYAGDANFTMATSGAQNLTVTQTVPTVAVASSLNPSVAGQSVTFTATLSSPLVTGTVLFTDFGHPNLGSASVVNGVATLPTTTLALGVHSIAAVYGGDSNFTGRNSPTLVQTVNQAVSSTSLTASPNPSSTVQTVTLTATVSPSNATGTVIFRDAATSLGSGTVSGGIATLTAGPFTLGSHSLTAAYSGDTNDTASTSPAQTHTVGSPTASVSLGSLMAIYDGTPKSATGFTSPAGLKLHFTYNGSATAPTAASTYTVLATVSDNVFAGSATGTLTIGVAKPSGTLTMAAGSPITTGTNTVAVANGDFNGDGFQDIASVSSGDGTVTVLLGDGTGHFTQPHSPFAAGTNPSSIAVGDFNGDGVQDLAVANFASNNVTVLLGDGTGNFNAAAGSPFAVGSGPVGVVAADLNGDGFWDLAVVNTNDSTVSVLLSNGVGGFSPASGSPLRAGVNPLGLALGDFNLDGKLDIAVADFGEDAVLILKGNGLGAFPGSFKYTNIFSAASIVVADFNGDGKPDFATANEDLNAVDVRLGAGTLGSGASDFPVPAGSPYAVGSFPEAIVVADLNGDGIPDLAVTNSDTGGVTVMAGSGTGGFSVATGAAFPGGFKGLAVGDFNGDGLADLVVAGGANQNQVGVLLGAMATTASALSTTSAATVANGATVPLKLLVTDSVTAYNAPTGAVTFSDGATVIGTAAAASSPYTFTTAALAPGSHTFTASYAGDTRSVGSSSGNSVTIMVSPSSASVTLGRLTATYDGTPKSVTATTVPASLAVNFTYNGSSTAPTAAGSYAVVGTISDPVYSGSATGTLVIGQASGSVSLGSLSATYDGTPHAATASSVSPAGLTVNVTYNGNPTAPTAAGSYAVVGTIADSNVTGSTTGTLVIAKANATVTLGGLSAIYDGTAKAAIATSIPSALSVAFTYNGSSTAPSAVGSYSVAATVTDPNYTGAATGTLVIGQGIATVTLGSLAPTYDGTPKQGTAVTSPAGKTVTFTYNGSPTAPTGAGSYTVVGTVSDSSYTGSATGMLVIAQANATVTLGSLSPTYDGSSKAVTAVTNPTGRTVAFLYNGSPSAPTVAGSYGVSATITDPNYTGSAAGSLVIAKATASVSLTSPTVTYDGTAKSASATSTTGGLTIAVTYNGASAQPTAAGIYSVAATVNDTNYAGTGTGTLTILKATPVIAWPQPAAVTYGGALGSGQLNATANVPGTFAYSPAAGAVLPVGTAEPLSAIFTPSDATDYAAVTASNSITVNPPPPTASPANLVVTKALTRSGATVLIQITIANTGGSAAANVTLASVKLGTATATPLPQNIGTVAAGASATVTVSVPGSVGAAGVATTMTISGTYTGGTFSSSARVALP